MRLSQLVYLSDASGPIDDATLARIRDSAVRNNGRRGITGVLLYGSGHFLQLLEGDLHVLNELYELIRHDVRHRGVTLLSLAPIPQRSFEHWNMGVVNLDRSPVDRNRLVDVVYGLRRGSDPTTDPCDAAIAMLEGFRTELDRVAA